MTPPVLLLLAEDQALSGLAALRAALAAVGVLVRTPQGETRIGRSPLKSLDEQLTECSAGLVVGPSGPLTSRAFYAFQAKVTLGRKAKLFVIADAGVAVPEHLYAIAVVLPILSADHLASSIRAALDYCADESTLRGPASDNPNGPFLSNEAWPTALASPSWPDDLTGRPYDEARNLYWEGLFQTGYLEQWDRRRAVSAALLRLASDRDPLNRSLVLSKGVAYPYLVRGSRSSAIRALRKSGEAAQIARSRRARSYVFEYRGDLAVRDGNIRAGLEYYDEALSGVGGVEAREVELKSKLVVNLNGGGNPGIKLAGLRELRTELSDLMNYRTGVVDIMVGRELAAAGETDAALKVLRESETFFRDVLPMPRNLSSALDHIGAIESDRPTAGLRLPW